MSMGPWDGPKSDVLDPATQGDLATPLAGQWHLLSESPLCTWGLDATTAFGYVHIFYDAMMGANGFLNRLTTPWLVNIRSADFVAVAGKTLKLRSRLVAFSNATDPGVDLAFDLRPVTTAGGADAMTVTIGSAVSSSGGTITNAALNASDQEMVTSSSFSLPSDGFYTMLVVPSTTIANNSQVWSQGRVEYRWE